MDDNKIIIYQDDNDVTRVSVRFADEDLWLTQNQLAEIYDTTQENISMHIANIYRDGELELEMNPMTMKDWIETLDNQIIANKRKVLAGKGTVSKKLKRSSTYTVGAK